MKKLSPLEVEPTKGSYLEFLFDLVNCFGILNDNDIKSFLSFIAIEEQF